MKIYFTVILLSFFSLLQAQNFTFEPASSIAKTISISDISDININIIRAETVDTLWLEYELISNSLPEEWYAGYCDNHGCWGSLPENGYMSPMYEDLNSYIKLSINPEGLDGSGIVEYYIYEIGHYEEGMLMTFIVDTPGFVGVNGIQENHTSFHPNPFSNQLTINSNQNIIEVNVFDIMGRLLEKIDAEYQTQLQINSSHWPRGIYLIELKNESGQGITRKLTKK